MSQISVDDKDKDWFDSFQEDDETQAECFSRMVSQVKAFQGEPVDHEELARNLEQTLIPMTEIAAYRAISDFMESNGD